MRPAALAISIVAILLVGCGDDEEATTGGAEEASTIEVEGEPGNYEGAEAVSADPVPLEEDDYYFEPTVLTGDPGQKVTLEITNEGDEEHNITIDEQGVDEDTEAGESTTVKAEIPDSGVVPFYCSYHEAENMRGALAVTGSEPTAGGEAESTDSGGGYGGY